MAAGVGVEGIPKLAAERNIIAGRWPPYRLCLYLEDSHERPDTQFRIHPATATFPLDASHMVRFVLLALPQIPLSLGNSI